MLIPQSREKHLWLFPLGGIAPETIRDGKPGLAPKAFGAALQLLPRVRDQNDSYEAAASIPNDKRQDQ
jgi:hypothetical protein